MSDNLIEMAESNVKEKDPTEQKRLKKGNSRVKLISAAVLFILLVAVAFNSWKQIQRMYEPPELSEQELIEEMNSYLFVSVSKLLSYEATNARLPLTEEELLGWDDPLIEYSTSGESFILSVLYADTVISFESGDDPSELLTEDALRGMGIVTD